MQRAGDIETRKTTVKALLLQSLADKQEIGLNDIRRRLAWQLPREPLIEDGRFMAKMLNAIGWRRDGTLGTGYDREPRYTRCVA